MVREKRKMKGSRAGEENAEGQEEEDKKKMYTDDKHAICCVQGAAWCINEMMCHCSAASACMWLTSKTD